MGWLQRRRWVYMRDLLRELVVRDMKLRYKRSILGMAWTLLNPLAQLLVFRFVFTRIVPVSIPNFSSFLFSGILVWNWFASALLLATTAIVDNRELIKQPGFPAGVLPVVTVASHLIHFLLALPILFGLLAFEGTRLTNAMLALPVVITLQFVLTLSVAYLVATFHVRFRDTQYLLGVLLNLMFFLTPIFYETGSVPARFRLLYRLNPMAHLINAYRGILIRGELPDGPTLLVLSVLAVALFYVGHAVFVRASWHFVEEL